MSLEIEIIYDGSYEIYLNNNIIPKSPSTIIIKLPFN